jgi:hypothetical protein
MEPGDSFFALRNFVKGKITDRDLLDSDKLITRVIPNSNRAQSVLFLEFENENSFLKVLNIDEDDIHFFQSLVSPYNSYDIFHDYDSVEDDFLQGYGPWYHFDSSNQELMEKISKVYFGEELDFDSTDSKTNFAENLMKIFPREISDFLSDYTRDLNQTMEETASEEIDDEIKNFLKNYGFELIKYDGVKATIADLLSLYVQYNVPHVSLKKLLKTIFEKNNEKLGGWDEDRYRFADDKNFDTSQFNRSVERNLESIIEKYEDSFNVEDLRNFLQMIDRVSAKYGLKRWLKLPKNPQVHFKINGFDRENQKIDVSVRSPSSKVGSYKMTEEALNLLLYQPELFNFELG